MARPKKSAMDAAIEQQVSQESESGIEIDQSSDHASDLSDCQPQDVSQEVPRETEEFNNADIPAEDFFSDEEKRAIESGWTPKSVYNGDPNTWRDAKAWNERNRTYNAVEEQKRELAELRKSHNEMLELLRSERAERAQTQINSLEIERENAIRNSNVDLVKSIETKINSLRNVAQPYVQNNTPVNYENKQIPQEVHDFVARNTWFNGNDELSIKKSNYAKMLEQDLSLKQPNMSLADKYRFIEQSVSSIFDNKKEINVPPVESRRISMTPNKPINGIPDYNSLPREAREHIEFFAQKAAFKAKQQKKPFNITEFRNRYIRELHEDNIVNSKGSYNPKTEWRKRTK